MSVLAPLSDITNVRRTQSNIAAGCLAQSPLAFNTRSSSCESTALSPEMMSPMSSAPSTMDSPYYTVSSPKVSITTYRHDPYNWKCLPDTDAQAAMLLAQRAHLAIQRASSRRPVIHIQVPTPAPTPSVVHRPSVVESEPAMPHAAVAPGSIHCLVQFKCHHAEYSSNVIVERGQYVAVQGDRGMDIGVVIRVNDSENKGFIERTGPCGNIMRHATQREVDYWASELKQDEATALEFCRHRTIANELQMEVRHAEYQFDKKKLTFYYDAKVRVDFVTLLKELYREYGCRIWMEKVRAQAE